MCGRKFTIKTVCMAAKQMVGGIRLSSDDCCACWLAIFSELEDLRCHRYLTYNAVLPHLHNAAEGVCSILKPHGWAARPSAHP